LKESTAQRQLRTSFDFTLDKPSSAVANLQTISLAELLKMFGSQKRVNRQTSSALFDFIGLLQLGVGDPQEAQLSVRFECYITDSFHLIAIITLIRMPNHFVLSTRIDVQYQTERTFESGAGQFNDQHQTICAGSDSQ